MRGESRIVISLVVHGMFCRAWHTEHLVTGLREGGVDAMGLTLPGREGGTLPSLKDLVHFVKGEAEAAHESEGAPVALVGHSMGGLVCLLAAAELADRSWLRKLALFRWLDDHFDSVIVVIIALVTAWGGLIAFLETWAGNHSDTDTARSQALAMDALGHDMSSRQRENLLRY